MKSKQLLNPFINEAKHEKKLGVFLLTLVLFCQAAVLPTHAVLDASEQLSSYWVSLVNGSAKTMYVNYNVYGTGYMSIIGAKQITIQQHLGGDVWQTVYTFGTQYAYNSLYKVGSLSFTVTPGMTYRATLTAYAMDYSGESDTKSVTTGAVVATT